LAASLPKEPCLLDGKPRLYDARSRLLNQLAYAELTYFKAAFKQFDQNPRVAANAAGRFNDD